jgi:hypothetical protein
VVIGDPTGVRDKDAGAVHDRRTHRWLVVHTTSALCYRLEEAGIAAELTDERGTSSHCSDRGAVAKEQGRVLSCTDPACGAVRLEAPVDGCSTRLRTGRQSSRPLLVAPRPLRHRQPDRVPRRTARRARWREHHPHLGRTYGSPE